MYISGLIRCNIVPQIWYQLPLLFSLTELAGISDPHLSSMNCLTQTCFAHGSLCQRTGEEVGWEAGSNLAGKLWFDAGIPSTSWLAAFAVAPDPLLTLSAPFGVHARRKEARNRWETVWSLSEIDKFGKWSFTISANWRKRRLVGNVLFFIFAFLPLIFSHTSHPA